MLSSGLSSPDAFDAAVKSILPKDMLMGRAGASDLRTVKWQRNTLSYRLSKEGLLFSPLLHPLQDHGLKGPVVQTKPSVFSIHYPSSGTLKDVHYTFGHLMLQASTMSNFPMSPNDIPSFAKLGLKNESWERDASFRCWTTAQHLELAWHQPFGPLGAFSGIKLQSSGLIYFLSLCNLTYRSF
jgi:hypothetical protein